MQKKLNKITAIILIMILMGLNFAPTVVMASSEISQNSKTSQENVEFNATVGNSYNTSINLEEEGALLLNVKVSDTGYLKDVRVSLKNNNYEVKKVNGVELEGSTIKLNDVNAGEVLEVSMPIKFNKEEKVLANEFDRETLVTLDAIYVNEKGKEKKVSKTLKHTVKWTFDAKETLSQTLLRYVKYDDKTIMSFKIDEGIEDNKVPVSKKELKINVPTLEGNKPSKVIVTGKDTKYSYEEDILTISKENTPDSEGKIAWNSVDTYIVTYVYDSIDETIKNQNDQDKAENQSNSQFDENGTKQEKIENKITANVITINNSNLEKVLENSVYDLRKTGSLIESFANGTQNISKGYMYTNLNRTENKLETAYELNYIVNIPYTENVSKIRIAENDTLFNNEVKDITKTRKIRINKDNLTEILGQDGVVDVLLQNGTKLGTLSKDSEELEVNENKLIFETSNIVKEGNLEINLSKVISNEKFTKNELKQINEMTSKMTAEAYNGEEKISSKEIEVKANLTEPSSNASIDIERSDLSTVVNNEDVIITATLKTNDINDALYTNPNIKITLPEEVKNINLKDARLIYEDELKPVSFNAEGNEIELGLSGTQTKYSSQVASEGTVLRVVADMELDNLAPTSKKTATLVYTNESTGEEKKVDTDVNIVAPTGFVTTNSVEIDGIKHTSQESDEKTVKLQANATEKEATISGIAVNNLGNDVTGVTILGVIPTKENKDSNGKNLGSNFDTLMASTVNVEGIEAEIYYSSNVNEEINSSNWSKEFLKDAKVFKIVTKGACTNKSVIKFDYKIKIPANLGYGNIAKATYAVYYNNYAERGTNQNYVIARPVGLTTGEIPAVNIETSIIDTNSGEKIENLSEIKEGKYITYRIEVKNAGSEVANNIKATTSLPEGISQLKQNTGMGTIPEYIKDEKTKTLIYSIEELPANSTKTIEYRLVVSQVITGIEGETTKNTISTSVIADKLEENVQMSKELNVVKGDVSAYVTSDKNDKSLKTGETVSYYLNLKNANNTVKNNIEAVIIFPEEMEIVNVINNDGSRYETKGNTVIYKKEKLSQSDMDGLLINAKVKELKEDKEVKIAGTIKCDGMTKEDNLEAMKYLLVTEDMKVSLTSNIEDKIYDIDELEYYIDVKNNKNEKITVNITDTIPSELMVIGYRINNVDGDKDLGTNARTIMASMTIAPRETGKLTIITKPYKLDKDASVEVNNKAVVEQSGIRKETNNVTHTIYKSQSEGGNNNSGNQGGNNGENQGEITVPGTYRISGTVWFDKNLDNKKDEGDERLSGYTVKLYDKGTGKIAVDANGNEQVKTTNNDGRYTFANVTKGNYIVAVEYNDGAYDLVAYKVENVLDSENSDFVNSKIDEKTVAVTDTINIENSNVYNIDLGLVAKKKFDLKLDKTVTRITVTNTKDKIKTRIYDFENKSISKVELANTYIDFATVAIEYSIKITNEGEISGYAKNIIDYIPEGMTFSSEINNTWYIGKDGNAYNTSLANTIINPGETKELKLVLSRKMSDENTGVVRNTAEILESYNEFGQSDVDSVAGNKMSGEDDMSGADTVIGIATGKTVMSFTGITLGILSIIAVAIYEIKKHVISKLYNIL